MNVEAADLPAKLSPEEAASIRLENQFSKWLKASASKGDISDLLEAGRISSKEAKKYEEQHPAEIDDLPTSVSGMDALGSLIMRQFPKIGIQVNRQAIRKWRKLLCVPSGCNVPFPGPATSNRYNVAECFAWVQTYFGPHMGIAGEPDVVFGATQELENKIKQRKLELLDMEVGTASGRLSNSKTAQMAVTGAVMAHHSIVKRQMDNDFARLVLERLDGLDEADRRKVHDAVSEVARSIVTAIETDCEKYGR